MAIFKVHEEVHKRPPKFTPVPGGVLIESAYASSSEDPELERADAVKLGDGLASVFLSTDETYLLQCVLGGGEVVFENLTGLPIVPELRVTRNGTGPKFVISLTKEKPPEPLEELEPGAFEDGPAAGAQARQKAPQRGARVGAARGVVESKDADHPAQHPPRDRAPRRKRGRPRKVPARAPKAGQETSA